jgi:hypothetical protein
MKTFTAILASAIMYVCSILATDVFDFTTFQTILFMLLALACVTFLTIEVYLDE